MTRTHTTLLAVASLSAAASAQTNTIIDIEKTMLSGEVAPGTGGARFEASDIDVEFVATPSEPMLSQSGRVAFGARLQHDAVLGVDESNDFGIWTNTRGTLELITRTGAGAPVIGGAIIDSQHVRGFNTAGQVLINALLVEGVGGADASNRSATWLWDDGNFELLVRSSDQAPGTGGAVFESADGVALNESGHLGLRTSLQVGVGDVSDLTNASGFWTNVGGALQLVVRRGDALPAVGGARLEGVGQGRVKFNDQGDIVFRGPLVIGESGVTADNNDALWYTTGGSLLLAAREGDPAVGTFGSTYGALFDAFPVINAVGHIAARVELSNPPNAEGIWAARGGPFTRVVRTGAPAPGVSNATFDEFGIPTINDAGRILFDAGVTATPSLPPGLREGLWIARGLTIEPVVIDLQPAPGSGGAVFRDVSGPRAINIQSDVVGLVRLAYDGNLADLVDAAYLFPNGGATPIPLAIEGQAFDVDPDPLLEDLRVVREIIATRGFLNDQRTAMFLLEFEDGTSGLFTATLRDADVPGDVDGDGSTTTADLTFVVSNLGAGAPGATGTPGDANGDGETTTADITLVVSNLGSGTPTP